MSDNSKMFVSVLVDDFQWITKKHTQAAEIEFENSDIVLFVINDSDLPRSIVSPFTYEERYNAIKNTFPDYWAEDKIRIIDAPSQKYYDGENSYCVQAVKEAIHDLGLSAENVLSSFQTFDAFNDKIKAIDEYILSDEYVHENTPQGEFLEAFKKTYEFSELLVEAKDKKYISENFGKGPFHTADVVCLFDEEVLLISRKGPPYRHMVAFPGGLLDPGEVPFTAAVRELLEETEMKLPAYIVNGTSPVENDEWIHVTEEFIRTKAKNPDGTQFNSLGRDPRGDYRANVFVIDFSDLPVKPKVIGQDDAEKANFIDKAELTTANMAFDHFASLCAVGVTKYPEDIKDARHINEIAATPTL